MRRNSIWILLIGIIMLAAPGCKNKGDGSLLGDEKTAEEFVKSSGYKIQSYLGEVGTYTLDREKIVRLPNMSIWSVQKTEPDLYFGKSITTYGFVVSDHPLDEKYVSILSGKDYEIQIHIMLTEGQVIGGTSIPVIKSEALMLGSGYYALDGEDLEEITGMSYPEWLDAWEKKYGEYQGE